ncbi:MAG: hypothetical protein AAGA91_05040 [Pseudomonadota bacterium]
MSDTGRAASPRQAVRTGAGLSLIVLGVVGFFTGQYWVVPLLDNLGDSLTVYPIALLAPFTPGLVLLLGALLLSSTSGKR